MKYFDIFNIELPYIARSLCKEALELANNVISEMDKEEIESKSTKLFNVVVQHIQDVGLEKFEGFSPDAFNFFKYPTDLKEAEDFKNKTLHLDDGIETELSKLLDKDDGMELFDEKSNPASSIFFMIQQLKTLEDQLLSVSDTPDYKEAMKYLVLRYLKWLN